jgi:DNA polymerase-1
MRRLVFDIETDGLDDATTVHSLCIKDIDTGEKWSCYGSEPHPGEERFTLDFGLNLLAEADWLGGHNILTYDIPTLKRLRGFEPKPGCLIRDTLVCTRLIWTDLSNEDFRRRDRGRPCRRPDRKPQPEGVGLPPRHPQGPVQRVGRLVEVDARDARGIASRTLKSPTPCGGTSRSSSTPRKPIQLEHDFRWIIHLQERHGFRFNVEAAGKLHAQLVGRKDALIAELQKLVPPTRIEMKTPEYYFSRDPFGNEIVRAETKTAVTAELKRLGLKVKDFPPQPGPNKFKLDHFNPGSRQQVAEYLISKGWKPAKFTDTGQPQVDETVLEGIDFPEAKLLREYFIVGKLLGQLAEGDNSWLKLARKGRIHGQMNTNGAVTGRAAHFKPNVGQVPSVMVGKDKHPLLGIRRPLRLGVPLPVPGRRRPSPRR